MSERYKLHTYSDALHEIWGNEFICIQRMGGSTCYCAKDGNIVEGSPNFGPGSFTPYTSIPFNDTMCNDWLVYDKHLVGEMTIWKARMEEENLSALWAGVKQEETK